MKHSIALAVACAAMLIATPQGATADQTAFRTAETVRDIKKMGAKQMAGTSVEKIMSGRTFKNPEWTWSINADGTQSSKALDGSWSDAGTWEVVGNQYCRESDATNGRTICSYVYFLGRDMRFTQDANPRRLLDWFVTY